jgi:hypothetical protein
MSPPNSLPTASSGRTPGTTASGSRLRSNSLALLFLVGAGAWIWQVIQELSSTAGCASEGLCFVTVDLRLYAQDNKGIIAAERPLRIWAERHRPSPEIYPVPAKSSCGRFAWTTRRLTWQKRPRYPVVWCGRPHGFYRRWRNVVFDDLTLREVPEGEVAALLSGQPARDPSRYESTGCVQPGRMTP